MHLMDSGDLRAAEAQMIALDLEQDLGIPAEQLSVTIMGPSEHDPTPLHVEASRYLEAFEALRESRQLRATLRGEIFFAGGDTLTSQAL